MKDFIIPATIKQIDHLYIEMDASRDLGNYRIASKIDEIVDAVNLLILHQTNPTEE